MQTRTYYYRGLIERGTGKPRLPYKWVEGWSENSESGQPLSGWMSQKECREHARRDGLKAIFEREPK